jgi:hypothetical protein
VEEWTSGRVDDGQAKHGTPSVSNTVGAHEHQTKSPRAEACETRRGGKVCRERVIIWHVDERGEARVEGRQGGAAGR